VAVSCTVCPAERLAEAGLTVMDATGAMDIGAVDLSHEATSVIAARTVRPATLRQSMEKCYPGWLRVG